MAVAPGKASAGAICRVAVGSLEAGQKDFLLVPTLSS